MSSVCDRSADFPAPEHDDILCVACYRPHPANALYFGICIDCFSKHAPPNPKAQATIATIFSRHAERHREQP